MNGKHKKKLKKELNYFKRHSQSYLNENLSSELETCHFKDQSDCSKDSGSSYSFKCESDASESSLQKRRDYLKRKLEEEEEEADNTDSSDCVIIQVCNKSHQKESSPTHHRRKRIGIDSPNPKTKLKSQVVKKEN